MSTDMSRFNGYVEAAILAIQELQKSGVTVPFGKHDAAYCVDDNLTRQAARKICKNATRRIEAISQALEFLQDPKALAAFRVAVNSDKGAAKPSAEATSRTGGNSRRQHRRRAPRVAFSGPQIA